MVGFLGSKLTYATWNPADKNANVTLTGGNLNTSNGLGESGVRATIGKTSGKWYWEVVKTTSGETNYGIATLSATLGKYVGFDANAVGYDSSDGKLWKNNVAVGSGGATATTGDVIGIALDQDAGTVKFYKNGTLQYTYTHGLSGAVYPIVSDFQTGQGETANFGATTFAQSVPSGYNSGLF